MANNEIGYHEDPKNGNGIKRARTTKQIRSWEIPRDLKALESLNSEYGKLEFPSVYILFEGKNKVYIGEAKSVYNRLKTHINSPEDKIIVESLSQGSGTTHNEYQNGDENILSAIIIGLPSVSLSECTSHKAILFLS